MYDHIDGGLTLLLHCPGYKPEKDPCPHEIPLEVYVTPRELEEGGLAFSLNVAKVVQLFGEQFAPFHLRRFHEHCDVEGLDDAPPLPPFGRHI